MKKTIMILLCLCMTGCVKKKTEFDEPDDRTTVKIISDVRLMEEIKESFYPIGTLRMDDQVKIYDEKMEDNQHYFQVGINTWICDDGDGFEITDSNNDIEIHDFDMSKLKEPSAYQEILTEENDTEEYEMVLELDENDEIIGYSRTDKTTGLSVSGLPIYRFGSIYSYYFLHLAERKDYFYDENNRLTKLLLYENDKVACMIRFEYNGNLVMAYVSSEDKKNTMGYDTCFATYRIGKDNTVLEMVESTWKAYPSIMHHIYRYD